ncbi:MAG TPA: hypothetical protein VGH80_01935 [Xanthomonadaceae bacterium]|jgi:hypothetical protein
MNAKMEFVSRLKEALANQGLKATAAVVERGYNDHRPDAPITAQTARAWLRGAHMPGEEHMDGLAEWLRVDARLLRKGSSRYHVKEPGLPRMGKQDSATMHAFLALPASHRKLVREVIAALGGTSLAGKP